MFPKKRFHFNTLTLSYNLFIAPKSQQYMTVTKVLSPRQVPQKKQPKSTFELSDYLTISIEVGDKFVQTNGLFFPQVSL